MRNIRRNVIKNNKEFKNFYWQNGYGAFSISPSELDEVKAYIKNQSEIIVENILKYPPKADKIRIAPTFMSGYMNIKEIASQAAKKN